MDKRWPGRLYDGLFSAPGKSSQGFWLGCTLLLAGIYGTLGLRQAFAGDYIVQDDARQHVFWMLRYLDPTLFPQDAIADYFQTVAPAGYRGLYGLAVAIGFNPLVFNKLLPPLLLLVTAGYVFALCLEILPLPVAGFMAATLFNQSLCLEDDLMSATPRAFIYPLLAAFLYYLTRRSWQAWAVILLAGLFYPQAVLLFAGILGISLLQWRQGRLRLLSKPKNYRFFLVGLAVAMLVLLPFALSVSAYDPTITAAQARELPEFGAGGRASFFSNNPWDFWLFSSRSGFFPRLLLTPITLTAGFLLPLILAFPNQFSLTARLTPHRWLLLQLPLASLVLFLAAHGLLFRLHLPSRYSAYSLQLTIALAAAIALTNYLEFALKRLRFPSAFTVLVIISGLIWLYPTFVGQFPASKYKQGQSPELYRFLQQQPKDTLIASLSSEMDFVPVFGRRSVLVSPEYAIPYQLGYYLPFRQRLLDLIQSQYSPNRQVMEGFIKQYGIDFWAVEAGAWTPAYLKNNDWLSQYQPATQEAIKRLESGEMPALFQNLEDCTVWRSPPLQLVAADCLLSQ